MNREIDNGPRHGAPIQGFRTFSPTVFYAKQQRKKDNGWIHDVVEKHFKTDIIA